MKKFMAVLLFCFPAFGQSAYSGRVLYSGPATYGASGCGPGNGYACFVQDTDIHNYSVPGPNWGPNTCDWTSPDTASNCGNLTGANTVRTPAEFGNALIRCTDMNTIRMDAGSVGPSPGNPAIIWTTYDSPSVNAWNLDDTGILLKATGGAQYVMRFNPATSQCTMTNPVITVNDGIWAHIASNKIYSYSSANQTRLLENIVNLATGSVTSSTLFEFNDAKCLANPINGVAGGFPQGTSYWVGTVGVSLDDSTFARGFSTSGAQGTGAYLAAWTRGQDGCDLWNTLTNVVTHNGTLVGTVSDTPWGGAYGGKYDKFGMHAAIQTPNPDWINTTASPNTIAYGTYIVGNYFWQKGTTNVPRCGVSAPNWKASTQYYDGDRVNPTTGNAGDYIYQIINGVPGMSGAAAPTWGQIPGQDTTGDNDLTWRNVGLGPDKQHFCDGHGWTGYLGLAPGKNVTYHSYADPMVPQTHLLSVTNAADQHFGNTNANTTDSAWIFVMSADYGTATKLLDPSTPYPSALYNEIYLISPPYNSDGSVNSNRAFRRAAHNYNSGWHQTFDVQNGMCVLSQTGNFALCSTDGMGQFGSTTGAASCNIGAPDWVKDAASDGVTMFATGYKMFPNPVNGGNNGDYIYQIQSCSGACSTGTTKPAYPQTAGATVVDGTITWVNTGLQQNCRADDVIVKLTR